MTHKTTHKERERWKENVRSVNEGAGVDWSWGNAILRLIADVERLTAAVQKHRRGVWGDGLVENDSDLELYQETLEGIDKEKNANL